MAEDLIPFEEAIEQGTVLSPVEEWRLTRFRGMGFSAENAELLALTRDAEVQRCELMLEEGCSLELALEILS